MVPPTLLAILKSLACHSAIRFGDPLTRSQSQEIIGDLLLCDLPFQCAHGRCVVKHKIYEGCTVAGLLHSGDWKPVNDQFTV